MEIYHIIKKSGFDTDFRTIMLNSLERIQALKSKNSDLPNITVYLASGFFNVSVSHHKTDVLSFVDPNTGDSLLSLLSGLNVEVFGAYNGRSDLSALKSILSPVAKTLKVYYKYRFHTKLFIIAVNNMPIFEIIGSSNLTIPAYEGLQYSKKGISSFSANTETDLILYNNEYLPCVLNNIFEDKNIKANVMRFEYRREDNNDIAFEKRMQDIIDYLEELKSKMVIL